MCSTCRDVKEVQNFESNCSMSRTNPYGALRERIEYEADPRHTELFIHQLGLSSSSRGVSTLGEKFKKPGVDHSTALGNTDHTL